MKKLGILILITAFFMTGLSNCGKDEKNKHWATTTSTKHQDLKLDVDAVQKAFENAKGPQDFENKVNEIYTGKEIISIAVQDKSKNEQLVTLYIDNNPQNGTMDEQEKILELKRVLNPGTNQVGYYRTGYGPYGYYTYHSPVYYTATGALLTYMMYRSLYYRPYYTPIVRYSTITTHRTAYRSTPAYRSQVANTRSFNNNFRKNAPKSFQRSTSSWGAKSTGKGSWGSGTQKATPSKSTTTSSPASTKSSTPSSTRSFSSSPSRSSSSSSRSFGSSRSSGGRRR
ncbi:MAG: hypothetical protein OEV44_02355 [Spirochaetota bacterium]|nr:hypothetical protein [Spirochaetota bacterium]